MVEGGQEKIISGCSKTANRILYFVMFSNECIIVSSLKKRQSKLQNCRKATGFLHKVTTNLICGRKTPVGIRPLSADKLIDLFNSRGYGDQWNVFEFEQHCANNTTLYFYGNDDPRDAHTLVMTDIDCHKCGTLEGAKALAQHLLTIFPNAYTEVSTNGNGIHQYWLLEKEGYTASTVKQGLAKMAAYLSVIAKKYDVQMVEMKGTPCVVGWAGSQIDHITYGQLGKLPRGASLEQLKQLPVVNLVDLLALDVEKVSDKKSGPKIRMAKVGSVSFDFADEGTLTNLEDFSTKFIGPIKTANGRTVPHDATAIALSILSFCKVNKSTRNDGSLPTSRIMALWAKLVEQGVTTRKFDGQMFAAIRNKLSELGLIDWKDNRYWWDADKAKGQAMKWAITDRFHELILSWMNKDSKDESTCKTREKASLYAYFDPQFKACLNEGQNLTPKWTSEVEKRPSHWWDEYILDRLAA